MFIVSPNFCLFLLMLSERIGMTSILSAIIAVSSAILMLFMIYVKDSVLLS